MQQPVPGHSFDGASEPADRGTVDRVPVGAAERDHQPFVPAGEDPPELTAGPLVIGALLGFLMMSRLRRALIVKEAKPLVFPEGPACAEVLIAGEKGGTTAKTVFAGFGVGVLFKLAYQAFGLWKEKPTKVLEWFRGGSVSIEVAPELLGVGYVIGTRIALVMGAGGVLASLVIVPAIKLFGEGLDHPVYPATMLI